MDIYTFKYNRLNERIKKKILLIKKMNAFE